MSDSNAPASAAPARQRRQIVILVALVAVLAAVIYFVWPAAAPAPPSNSTRAQRQQAQTAAGTPGSLDVRLEELKQPPPQPGEGSRNPFRFYVKPPPPPPPPPRIPKPGESDYKAPAPPPRIPKPGDPDYVAPPPPPIPLKFTGMVEVTGKKVAIFCDGKGMPVHASAGQLVLGQYRVVTIGVESVTMEYADGRGRQVIPLRGCMG